MVQWSPDRPRSRASSDGVPWAERGVEQARLAGRALQGKGISKIYTSPFLRCVQTAHAIAEELGGLPVHVEDGMAEYLNPDWCTQSGRRRHGQRGGRGARRPLTPLPRALSSCGRCAPVPGRPAGTDLASLLAMERFHLLRPDYVSRVTARFPETIDPATLLHDPHECGICNDYVEPTEEQAAAASAVTNHITDRGSVLDGLNGGRGDTR